VADKCTLDSRAAAEPISHRHWQYTVTVIFAAAGVGGAAWFSRIPAVRDDLYASTGQISVLLLAPVGWSDRGADPCSTGDRGAG
jgi:hypothetical protein